MNDLHHTLDQSVSTSSDMFYQSKDSRNTLASQDIVNEMQQESRYAHIGIKDRMAMIDVLEIILILGYSR